MLRPSELSSLRSSAESFMDETCRVVSRTLGPSGGEAESVSEPVRCSRRPLSVQERGQFDKPIETSMVRVRLPYGTGVPQTAALRFDDGDYEVLDSPPENPALDTQKNVIAARIG